MKLSFKYVIKKTNDKNLDIVKDLIWHSEKVSNMLLYEIKENKRDIENIKSLNLALSKIYKEYRENNWHSKYLHSHMLEYSIKNTLSNYKSYLESKKLYYKDKSKLKGIPNLPRYKNDLKSEIVFTNYAIRVVNNKIKLSLSKEMKEKYKLDSLNFLINGKLRKLVDFENIKMIKIRIKYNKIELNFIYEKEIKNVNTNNSNIMSIDLGLNNIVACTNKDNNKSLLISGKPLKSKNKYYNEKISHLQKINMLALKDSKKHKNTKRINILYNKRKNYINTYLHKVSKMVIDYAEENNVSIIVIGDIEGIKQNMNYNKNFVQIPLQELVGKIKYKAELNNIKVEFIKETYTSGVSFLDNEDIIKENYNKNRRITRGLFISNKGIKINADINGSLNILKKYINSSPNQEFKIAMDNGREQRPLKKKVA